MEITKIPLSVLSSDGVHHLAGWVYLPQGEPRAYYHVVHGMEEHIGRYDAFMRRMAQEGCLCFGYDHLGHGHTAGKDELGFIAHKNGWLRLAEDVGVFSQAVRAQYGDLPYYLMGHSMGSFVVRLAAWRYVRPDRLIVMGTGGPNPAAGAGLLLCRLTKLFRGEKAVSPLLRRLTFGSYNSRFGNTDPRAWLSTEESTRRQNAQDEFCRSTFTVSAMQDLIRLNKESNSRGWFAAMAGRMPILLASGDQDPVGDYGAGVAAVERRLKAAGADVRMRLYPGYRHEILNDACREQVVEDILAFLAPAPDRKVVQKGCIART